MLKTTNARQGIETPCYNLLVYLQSPLITTNARQGIET